MCGWTTNRSRTAWRLRPEPPRKPPDRLQTVEARLLKTVVRAPFDCTILARPVSVGQAVSGASGFNSGTEVFIVANLADMIITAHINQSDVTHLKVGQAVRVDIEAVSDLSLTGHVDRNRAPGNHQDRREGLRALRGRQFHSHEGRAGRRPAS